MEGKEIRILIAGAHSGGHLFPALAVARALKKKFDGARILFATSGGSLEREAIGRGGFEEKRILVGRLKGMNLKKLLAGFLLLPVAIIQSLAMIFTFKPSIVISFGGFTAGPVILASFILGRRSVIFEPNSVPGLTNKISAFFACSVITNFDACGRYFPVRKVKMLGIPVRDEIKAAGVSDVIRNRGNILVFGGSQGAHFINMEIPGILAEVNTKFPLKIVHQTGESDYEAVRELYEKLNLKSVVEKFIHNMADCYKSSCLAICRAGAATIGELGTMGLPAFFIPFPHATDNHQFFNAKELVSIGAAFMMEQKDFDRAKAVSWILEYLGDDELSARMAGRMLEFGRGRGNMEAILKEVLSNA